MTSALFDRARHEPLVVERWNESDVRVCIDEIVEAAVQAYSPEHLFRPHPQDDMLTGNSIGTSLYAGATGVFWGITHLSEVGIVHDRRNWVRPRLDAMIAAHPDVGFAQGSLLFGAVPTLALRVRLTAQPDAGDLAAIHARLNAAAAGPVQELMWGIPGGALLAEWLLRQTGDQRWQSLLRAQLDAIWRARTDLPGVGLIWQEELYGAKWRYLGPVHGFAGQVLPLLRAFTLLSAEQQRDLRTLVPRTLRATAVRGEQGISWPSVAADAGNAAVAACLVQYCHGAPGIVATFAGIRAQVLPDIDDLMLGGGEVIWAAGPLAKGSNLCHGTAGNGLALLKLFERTGDQRWLERARAFAMHAIRQYRQAKHRYGQDRYSLWTGDIGFAIFLYQCISELGAFPTVDEF